MLDKNNENYKLYLAGIISENQYYDLCDGKVNEVSDDGNDMILSNLQSIIDHANMLTDMIEPNSKLEEWMEGKIAICKAYLSDIAHAFKHDKEKENVGGCGGIPVADMGVSSADLTPIDSITQAIR